jgi:hypothetical protein
MGSAVDKQNLTDLLGQYHQAGIGGVEICPIYGARGYEDRYIDFLAPRWMQMLEVTTARAKRLDMGVDMTTGTGWPMGGPNVSRDDASSNALLRRYEVAGGARLEQALPTDRLRCVWGISDKGEQIDLTGKAKDGKLDWTAPPGQWRIYVVAQVGPAQKVKRAAPGGEGSVLDPFSAAAVDRYLSRFDAAFASYHGRMPRAQFHDSYEYVGDWTNDLFRQFQSRRGYDLRTQLPALMGEGSQDVVARVQWDYRRTMAQLHMDYVRHWVDWCHRHGMLAREQAHGAPCNILDLYAAADIPETECYEGFAEENIPVHKCASSAAHGSGKNLTSAESFTWLDEQFQATLAQAKREADFLFLAGVNHIVFHGMPYSPKDAPWPGWVFYASVDFNPQGGLWRHLPAFCDYITRCQSILQSGKPDNDVLLYLPIEDLWHSPKHLLMPLKIGGGWMRSMPAYETAMFLWEQGYGYDEVSDAMLQNAVAKSGRVRLGGNDYRAIVMPRCRFVPAETRKQLQKLAQAGAAVIEQESSPQAMRQRLTAAGVEPETLAQFGIRFIRRSWDRGEYYFLVNGNRYAVSQWITLARPAKSVVILDPMFPGRRGVAAMHRDGQGRARVLVELQPGESCILRTFSRERVGGPPWNYWRTAGQGMDLDGTWNVDFVEGGPVLPAPYQTQTPSSWTGRGDADADRFAGTARYRIEFDRPGGEAWDWLLDLGDVCESAQVTLNGKPVGTLFAPPFAVHVGRYLRSGRNVLEVQVTNVAANRIADMDRRGIKWKIFQDPPNVMSIHHEPLDASDWPLRDSGLLGPVRLIPLSPLFREGGGG